MTEMCKMCGQVPVIVDKSRVYEDFCTECEKRILNRLEKNGTLRGVKAKAKKK